MWCLCNAYSPRPFLTISSARCPATGHRPRRSTIPHFVGVFAGWLHDGDRVLLEEGSVREAVPLAPAISVCCHSSVIDARARRRLGVGERSRTCSCAVLLEDSTTEDRFRLRSRLAELLLGGAGTQNTEHMSRCWRWLDWRDWRRRWRR